MRVKDRMVTRPVAASVPGRRAELLRLFRDKGFSGFPVVKEASRKLAGVVTRLDLFDNPDEDQVALLMNPNPTTTYGEASLEEAARLVHTRGLRLLPVVNGVNDLVGLITPAELLSVAATRRDQVSVALERRFVPIHRSTPVSVAFEIIRATHQTALPVLDDEARLCGILTDADLLRAAQVEEKVVTSPVAETGDGDAWDWERIGTRRRVRRASTSFRLPEGTVESLMVRSVRTVTPTTSVREAADIMVAGHLNQVPVVDARGRVVDLLSDIGLLGILGP